MCLRSARGFVFGYTGNLERKSLQQNEGRNSPRLQRNYCSALACGHTFQTRSTHKGDIRVEICSSCHPFFTGRQKLIDTAGRVDRFEKKYKAMRGDKDKREKQPA